MAHSIDQLHNPQVVQYDPRGLFYAFRSASGDCVRADDPARRRDGACDRDKGHHLHPAPRTCAWWLLSVFLSVVPLLQLLTCRVVTVRHSGSLSLAFIQDLFVVVVVSAVPCGVVGRVLVDSLRFAVCHVLPFGGRWPRFSLFEIGLGSFGFVCFSLVEIISNRNKRTCPRATCVLCYSCIGQGRPYGG